MALVPTRGPLIEMLTELERVDPDGAHELIRLALFEQLSEDVQKYGPGLREEVGKRLAGTTAEARRVLVREYVEKRERGEDVTDLLRAGAYLGAADESISKGFWDRREHPRGKNGRFITRMSGSDNTVGRQREATDAITRMQDSGFLRSPESKPKVKIHGHPLNEQGNPIWTQRTAETIDADDHVQESIEALNLHPTHVSVHQDHTNAPKGGPERLAFDITSRLAGERKGLQVANSAPLTPDKLGSSLDSVMRESDGTKRQAYRRMEATGSALRSLSTPGSGANTAGAVAQLTGQLGPEAEKVLGRPIARVAYRYRGTEKKPAAELVSEVDDVTDSADRTAAALKNPASRGALYNERYASARSIGAQNTGRSANAGYQGLAHNVAGYYAGMHDPRQQVGATQRGISDPDSDQLDLRMRGDTAVGYFARKLISPEQYGLSIAAGRVPPSQGAIINADGSVVSEAVGFGEDHYLPFDLKNLKALRGGQYVRTRSAGGPSTEDIYTGLLTGARQMQVVSNSGVFTVEFDPDLRGGRRYSDKAHQMVDRYQALLATVQRGDQIENPLPPEERQDLLRAAYEATNYNEADARAEYKIREREAIARARFKAVNPEKLEADARTEITNELGANHGMSRDQYEQEVKDRVAVLRDKKEDDTARFLQLDGVGYARALKSLQQEFPYFIRSVDHESLRDFDASRRLTPPGSPRAPGGSPRTPDRGYVGPGKISHDDGYGRTSNRIKPRTGPEDPSMDSKTGTQSGSSKPAQNIVGQRDAARSGGSADGELAKVGFRPTTGTKLSELAAQRPALEQEATQAFDGSKTDWPYAPSLNALGRPSPGPEDTFDNQRDPLQATRALFLDTGKLGTELASMMKPGPEQSARRQKLIAGLEQADKQIQLREDNEANLDHDAAVADRQEFPKAWFASTIRSLRLLEAADEPFAKPAADPAMYSPAGVNNPKPQAFAPIDALGDDPQNYADFRERASTTAPLFSAAVTQMERMDPTDRAAYVKREVDGFRANKTWGEMGYQEGNKAKPRGATASDWAEANQLAKSPAGTNRLLGIQQAWSFLHGQQIATDLAGGEVASPKAPGRPAPGDLWSGTEETGFVKRAPQVVVHPPGSPVAKAYSRLLRKRAAVRRQLGTS